MKQIKKAKEARPARTRMPPVLDEKVLTLLSTLRIMEDDHLACHRVIWEVHKRKDRETFVPALIVALKKGKHPIVRSSAAKVLGEIGSEQAKRPLKEAARKDKSPDVRMAAWKAHTEIEAIKLLETIFGKLAKKE